MAEKERVESVVGEEREFFGPRAHWDILMFVNLMLVALTSVQLWILADEPGERPVSFYLFFLSLFLYAFAFLWIARASRFARKVPLLRLSSEGLGIRSPSVQTFRVLPWRDVTGIAHQSENEIGVRLAPAQDGIADVVPVPLAFRGASAADVRDAIERWIDAEGGK